MKLSIDFPELIKQRLLLEAELSDWKIGTSSLDPRMELLASLETGLEIQIDDLEIGPGKLLTYQGEQVLLYIKDTQSSQWTLENEPEKSKRFHISECRTLEQMRRDGRIERYVTTNSMDGKFKVDWLDRDTGKRGEAIAELKVCKNCLKTLNWCGYENVKDRLRLPDGSNQKKDLIWSSFSIAEFLLDYSTFFRARPSRRDITAPLNEYVHNWPGISERKRRMAKWRCEQCMVDLSDLPGSLHCHHKNGVVTDNRDANLSVLCAICHAKQPCHQHMRVTRKQNKAIRVRRTLQGILTV